MDKTISELLHMATEQKTDYLQRLSCRELEVLILALTQTKVEELDRESFDRFFMTVGSILRDCREREALGKLGQ